MRSEVLSHQVDHVDSHDDHRDAEELRAFFEEISGVVENENEKGSAYFPPEFDLKELTKEDRSIWREFQAFEEAQKRCFSAEDIEAFEEKYHAYAEKVFADFDLERERRVTSRMMFQAYLGDRFTPYYLKINSGDLDRDKAE